METETKAAEVYAGIIKLLDEVGDQEMYDSIEQIYFAELRSLESLRDLDYQAWQLVAYREGEPGGELRLRVVGYPGRVRLDHPTELIVLSGSHRWDLPDRTLENSLLKSDCREAAAEFDLAPLLAELNKNRPLRLQLPGVFNELPVPPFVVKEWRELPTYPL